MTNAVLPDASAAARPAASPGKLETELANIRHLMKVRRRVFDKPANAVVKIGDYRLRITDGPNAYIQYKDTFVRGIYRFATGRPDPLIIDGGSNMGTSILGFKKNHPTSRVIAFEPDPAICRLLKENLKRNKVTGVTVIEAGLAAEAGTAEFTPDGTAGGQLAGGGPAPVKVVRLSDHLNETVDFLKLNIEGQELAVLREAHASGKLGNVQRMVVEYHGWAGGEQFLGHLLNLLNDAGFRYLVHDFDSETGSLTKPPFKHRPKADWFCLVHAQRA